MQSRFMKRQEQGHQDSRAIYIHIIDICENRHIRARRHIGAKRNHIYRCQRRGANGANRAKRSKWSQEEQTKPEESQWRREEHTESSEEQWMHLTANNAKTEPSGAV